MGLLDDLEAAERTEREPLRTRLLRRIGGGLAVAGVLMCLLGIFGGRWWTLEFDSGPIEIGLGGINYCDTRRDQCEELPAYEFMRYAASRSGGEREDVDRMGAWLDRRTPARLGLAVALLACVVVAATMLGPRRRDVTRLVAAVGVVVGVGALVLVWRFAGATPFDLVSRGLHAYVGVAGLVDLIVGSALAAIPSPHTALPTAQVVTRT
jgi:hypothetical protein